MGWKAWWKRFSGSSEKRINRKRNTLAAGVGGRSSDMAERRYGRLIKFGTIGLSLVLACLAIGFIMKKAAEELLYTNPEYRIARIDILSDGQRLSPAKVKQWAEVETGMNMHAVNIGKMYNALLRVPVIKSVEITRTMPDRLEIRLSERLPIACLGVHRLLGVDNSGYVFAIAPTHAGMPTITGFMDQISPGMRLQGRLLNAVEVVDVLNRTALGSLVKVEAVDVRDPNCVMLKLAEGPVVPLRWNDMAMSTPESRLALDRKLRSLARVLDDLRMKNQKRSKVDMTFNDEYIPVE